MDLGVAHKNKLLSLQDSSWLVFRLSVFLHFLDSPGSAAALAVLGELYVVIATESSKQKARKPTDWLL